MSEYISREDAISALEYRCKSLKARGGETAAHILTRYGIRTLKSEHRVRAAPVVQLETVRRIYRAIHEAGGCDATDEYSKGWDEAITEALWIVEKMTGVGVECLDEEEARAPVLKPTAHKTG